MKRFLCILQFMTRIPIKKELDVTREDYAKATIYFPIIGLIVGLVVSIVMYIAYGIFSPHTAAIMGVIAHIIVTGGIHLDGFSDTCDGIFSGRSRERILEIMKDSRLGTFGGVGLILIILTRLSLYFETLSRVTLDKNSLISLLMIVLASSIAARSVVLFFMYKRTYARENEGLGDLFIGKIELKELIINQAILLALLSLINYRFILIYVILLIIMLGFRKYIEKVLKGLTGDILGFVIEISEIIFIILALGLGEFLWI